MLNKFYLQFKSTTLEKEYRESQHTKIKSEFSAFTIQAFFFLICLSIQYFKEDIRVYLIAIICLLFLICLFIFKVIVDKFPHCINFILPLLQILIGLIKALNYFLSFSESEPKFLWFYGFETCYIHIAILVQGFTIWPQVIVLSIIMLGNASIVNEPTAEYASLFFSYFVVLIGIIFLKYTIEMNKRQEFLYLRERKNWFTIIEQVLKQAIIVIRLDKQQDQLRIHSMNHYTQETLKISTDQELRCILRDMKLNLESSTKTNSIKSLENVIRNMLLQITPEKSDRSPRNDKYYKQFICRSAMINAQFNVKLARYWIDEQQMIIMSTEQVQNCAFDSQKQEICLRDRLLRQLSHFEMKSYKYQNQLNQIQQIIKMNYFISIDIWQKIDECLNDCQICLLKDQFIKFLQSKFGQQITITNRLFSNKIIVNINSLLLAISCVLQFGYHNKEQVEIILTEEKSFFTELIIQISMPQVKINRTIQLYMQQPQYFTLQTNNQATKEEFRKQVQYLDRALREKCTLLALSIVTLKYILLKFGSTNQVNITQSMNKTNFYMKFFNE